MATLEISLLGSPQATIDSEPVSVDTRKAIALLAYLAVTAQGHTRDHLAALLWPESDQEHARAALRRTLSTLNRALGGDWLNVTRESIALRQTDDVQLDLARFRAAIANARTGLQNGAGSLAEAASLYRGDFMDGFHLRDADEFDNWQYLEGEQLRRELAWALERLVAIHAGQGEYERAIAFALRWLALDPLHEEAHRQLMLLYAGSGQIAAAVRQYRACVRILEQELGVEPLATTTELYEALRARPDQSPPAAFSGPAPVPRSSATEPRHIAAVAPLYPLVGRERELAILDGAFERAGTNGQLIVIEGEAGVGKSRLAQAFLEQARERGVDTLTLRCYEGEAQLTYGPIIDALKPIMLEQDGERLRSSLPAQTMSEIGRLFPELLANRRDVPTPAPLDSPGARTRMYVALLDALQHVVGGSRGVLFIDDAQWIDGASLELLAYFVHRLAGRPFLMLTWRDDQVADRPRLRGLLSDARRAGNATLVQLGRLRQQDVERLAGEVAVGSGAALGARLFQETDGLPFFVVQYLDELRRQPGDPNDGSWSLPVGVRDLLHARISALGAEDHQVLTTLAAIGSAAPFEIVLEASGRDEDEVVAAFEHLLERGLVSEHNNGELVRNTSLYDISHDRLRDVLYAETSPLRRRLLHRRIAEALRRRGAGSAQRSEAARIAHHLLLAGQDAEAADAYREAGDVAAELYANSESIVHYEAALTFGYSPAAYLHERIGDLQLRMGAYELAGAAYERAAAVSEPDDCGVIEHKLGNLNHRLGAWTLAERHYAAAEPLLAGDERLGPAELAQLHVDWSLTMHRQGNPEQAQRHAEQALALAGQADAGHALARSYNLLGILARGASDPRARSYVEESLRLARQLGDQEMHVAALNNLALLEHAADNHELALSLGREALELAVLQGDRHREAALHSNLADFLQALGQTDEAMRHLRASAVIYAEIGVVAGEHQAEIWKLSEW